MIWTYLHTFEIILWCFMAFSVAYVAFFALISLFYEKDDILKQFGSGGMSTQTMLELSYLIKDAKKEYDLIKQEQAERLEQEIKRQQELNKFDVFGQGE